MDIDRRPQLERYRTGARAVLDALADISDAELDQPSPDGGWTARQVAHHLADSETNSFIRLRRLIAEDDPVIVAYDEELYARRLRYDRPIASSLAVLQAVRAASLELLETLTPADWARNGRHSDSGRYSVDDWLDIYARHAHDHAAQIRRARGWEGCSTDRTGPDPGRPHRTSSVTGSPVPPPLTGRWEDTTSPPGVPCGPADPRRERGRRCMAGRSSTGIATERTNAPA